MSALREPREAPAQKSYQKMLEQETTEGLKQLERAPLGLLLSSFSAGLDLSFSLLLMGVMVTAAGGSLPAPVTDILVAMMYSIGFILVILGRSELFTEHTTRAVYPVLLGRASPAALLRLWGLIYVGNIAGTAVFAKITVIIGPALGIIELPRLGALAHRVVSHPWWVLVLSGILAGWLMGLLSWLVTASRDTISQVFFVWLITSAIGLCHLHHAVVGSAEVLAGVFTRQGPQGLTLGSYGVFELWATAGNIIGGFFFVAVLKYGHVVRGGREPEPVRLDEPEERLGK
ncbi:MAG: formate/nitrite transporter family protein [Terriglobia bacterium]